MAGAARRSIRTTEKRPRAAVPRADETFAAAIRASGVPMLLAEARPPGYPVAFANEAFCRLTGHAADEILGRDCPFLQEAGNGGLPLAHLRAALSRGEEARGEVRLARKDGMFVGAAVSVSPVRVASGTRYAFAVFTDVAAREDDDAAGSRAALQAALEHRTELLHELDHRAKNTLQVIASLLMLRARRGPDAATRAILDRMAERVGALAAVQRLGGPDDGCLDLRVFAEEMAGELLAGVEPGRITVSVEVEPILVPAAKAGPLVLLLHELAVNAIRHAFPDGRRGNVRIAAARADGRLALEVADDGVGLQATNPPRDGFGLSLIAMVARQLGGVLVWDEARPGTRAQVSLPLDAAGA
ncbi:sensor histidine kinase [Methylobacterium nodulans]|uniref:Blue-light-activated histidine kinase n=1 Tax=Methylobacterium nodulans (strain LMG 21967 / CNCM I-2342 / ORS 2060) TaxID=460265 RepID=B8IJ45_METNO|nr:PAS domain-containing protein [Methylobacterium nodulans]ACL61840.1 signal transduction histidine kinase [Methylobacterium nodulans ORS 2060]